MERWVVILDEEVPEGIRPEVWWGPVREFLREKYPNLQEVVKWNYRRVLGRKPRGGYGISCSGTCIEYIHQTGIKGVYKKTYSSTVRWERQLRKVLG